MPIASTNRSARAFRMLTILCLTPFVASCAGKFTAPRPTDAVQCVHPVIVPTYGGVVKGLGDYAAAMRLCNRLNGFDDPEPSESPAQGGPG